MAKTQSNIKEVIDTPKPTIDQKKQRLLWIGGGVLVLLALVAYQFKGQLVVAMVNGKPIMRATYIKALEAKGGKTILNQLITDQLIKDEANKKQLTIPPEKIDEQINTITENLKTQGSDLTTALAGEGMTLADLRTQIMMNQLVATLTASEAAVTDEEVQQYIKDNKITLSATKDKADETVKLVKQQLAQQKQQENVNNWVQGLMKKADIQYW